MAGVEQLKEDEFGLAELKPSSKHLLVDILLDREIDLALRPTVPSLPDAREDAEEDAARVPAADPFKLRFLVAVIEETDALFKLACLVQPEHREVPSRLKVKCHCRSPIIRVQCLHKTK